MMIILNWRDLIFFVAWNSTLHVPLFNSVSVWFASALHSSVSLLWRSVRRHLEGRSDNGGCCIPFCGVGRLNSNELHYRYYISPVFFVNSDGSEESWGKHHEVEMG